MTTEERNEISNQILIAGQMLGIGLKLNVPLLEKWLDSDEVPKDFRYEKNIRAAIKFQKESQL